MSLWWPLVGLHDRVSGNDPLCRDSAWFTPHRGPIKQNRCHLNIKMTSYHYMNSRYKDKMVLLKMEIPIPGKSPYFEMGPWLAWNFIFMQPCQGSHRHASKNFNDFSMIFEDKNPKFPWQFWMLQNEKKHRTTCSAWSPQTSFDHYRMF